jgi:hypothetical protein
MPDLTRLDRSLPDRLYVHDTLEPLLPLYKVTYDQLCRFALPAATVVVVAAAMVVVAAAVED